MKKLYVVGLAVLSVASSSSVLAQQEESSVAGPPVTTVFALPQDEQPTPQFLSEYDTISIAATYRGQNLISGQMTFLSSDAQEQTLVQEKSTIFAWRRDQFSQDESGDYIDRWTYRDLRYRQTLTVSFNPLENDIHVTGILYHVSSDETFGDENIQYPKIVVSVVDERLSLSQILSDPYISLPSEQNQALVAVQASLTAESQQAVLGWLAEQASNLETEPLPD